jgi:HPt (histidine-containing phosphotransfer) domain-containing protein
MFSELLASDPDLLDIVEEFVDSLGTRIAELKKAFAEQNWSELTTLAHRLKGAGGSYGYPEISALAGVLEQQFKMHSAQDFDLWMERLGRFTVAAHAGLPSHRKA